MIEHVGGDVFAESISAVRNGGRIVTCGATAGFHPAIDLRHIFFRQVEILGSTMGSKADLLAVLAHVAAGRLEPVVHEVLPLARAADAHRILEERARVRQGRARAMTVALALRGLGKDYGVRARAVGALDLDVERGECVGLLGPNGAGKTTTISMVVRCRHADARHASTIGGIDLEDRSLRARRPSSAWSRRSSRSTRSSPPMQNLRYFGALYGLARRDRSPSGSTGRSRRRAARSRRASRSRRTPAG